MFSFGLKLARSAVFSLRILFAVIYIFFSEVIHFICATYLAQLKSYSSTNAACVELVVLDSSTARLYTCLNCSS